MPEQPTLILDKSAFQGLSRDEHAERLFRYQENITPVLLREILADLAKSDATKSPERAVQILASKFLGSGGVVNADHSKLCAACLSGTGRFEVDGRPVLDDYSTFQESDGSLSILVDMTPANQAILRWAQAEYREAEQRAAVGLREVAGSFNVDALYGRLRTHQVIIPRPKTIPEIATIADDLLAQRLLQAPLMDWLMEQLQFPALLKHAIWRRWNADGRPPLAKFVPYAHHCARVLLLLLIGMRHQVLTSQVTNRIDAEYLFYLPFCDVFVSGDRLHEQLAPMVVAAKQTFIPMEKFKTEMAKLAAERHSHGDAAVPYGI
jgi:hypothetical protein